MRPATAALLSANAFPPTERCQRSPRQCGRKCGKICLDVKRTNPDARVKIADSRWRANSTNTQREIHSLMKNSPLSCSILDNPCRNITRLVSTDRHSSLKQKEIGEARDLASRRRGEPTIQASWKEETVEETEIRAKKTTPGVPGG